MVDGESRRLDNIIFLCPRINLALYEAFGFIPRGERGYNSFYDMATDMFIWVESK